MDRSYLSQPEVVAASRDFVCVRLMTYESRVEGDFLTAFNVTRSDGYRAALSWVELSTGACTAMSGTEGQVLDEIARLRPAEVLIPEHASGQPHVRKQHDLHDHGQPDESDEAPDAHQGPA